MSDVSKTNELITEAADRLRNYYEAGEMIHMASSYRTGDGVTHIIDFEDLRTVVEAAARVPVQGEPNDDWELKIAHELARHYPFDVSAAMKIAETAVRATVPDAATEELQADRDSLEERNTQLGNQLAAVLDERDAATAAVESVRVILAVPWREGGIPEHWHRQLVAALDGAPEPEWEFDYAIKYTGNDEHFRKVGSLESARELADSTLGDVIMHRVKACQVPAGPWLPVEGESNAN